MTITLVWTLALVDVYVLGADHVVRLFLLRAPGGRPAACSCACSSASCSGLRRSCRLGRLVEHFRDSVQHALDIFRSRSQPRGSTFGHVLLAAFLHLVPLLPLR